MPFIGFNVEQMYLNSLLKILRCRVFKYVGLKVMARINVEMHGNSIMDIA